MSKSFPLPQGLMALSLSVTLLAGCAGTPVAVPATPGTPAATTPAADAPASQPSAQTPAAPAMPAPAAAAPMTLTGAATFRGEALSGYTVTVLDAQTGEPVTVTNDLASAKGLAVLAQTLKTDANGRFTLQVANLGAGQALRVQVAYGNAKLESIVTANGQALGAKGYSVADTATVFEISELTTAIARIAANVIRTTKMLTAEEAAPELAKLAAEMASLTSRLEDDLKNSPGLAKSIVSVEGDTGEKAVESLIRNAGELKNLTDSIAGLVADIAKAASTSKAVLDPKVRESLSKIDYTGTVIGGSFDATGTFKLSNLIDGSSINANGGNLSTVTTRINRPSSGNNNGVTRDPNGRDVTTYQQFVDAVDDDTVSTIYVVGNLEAPVEEGVGYHILVSAGPLPGTLPGTQPLPAPPSPYVNISRAVTIDGQGTGSLTLERLSLHAPVKLKNLTVNSEIEISQMPVFDPCLAICIDSGAYRVTSLPETFAFDHVTIHGLLSIVSVFAPVEVAGCTFPEGGSAAIEASMGSQPLTVSGCTIPGGYNAITVTSSGTVSITGNTITVEDGYGIMVTPTGSLTQSVTISGNTLKTINANAEGINIEATRQPAYFLDLEDDNDHWDNWNENASKTRFNRINS